MARKHNIHHLMETLYGAMPLERHKRIADSHHAFRSFKAKAQAQRTFTQKLADGITATAGNMRFVALHVIWFGGWLAINLGWVPQVPVFDPFPFGLLTMVVSLEAIFLSIFVLISQNRESQISDLREELNFQITKQSEQEITKLLNMVNDLHQHFKLSKKRDKELEKMKKALDPEKLRRELENEV